MDIVAVRKGAGGRMPFIELTRYPEGRLLLNIDNVTSIYLGKRRLQSGEIVDVTVVQETTSADNYWEVVETINEIIAIIKAQEENNG